MTQKTVTEKTIAIAADHAGVETKSQLTEMLSALGYQVLDLGTHSTDSVDYPDYANAVVRAMKEGRAAMGVLICGSGIGMSIAANRHSGIRAALCSDPVSAALARRHNDANILVIGARTTGIEVAKECVRVFFSTAFEAGRHARRIEKIG